MGVILDTSIWVDAERGRLTPLAVHEAIGEEDVYLTPIVLAELQYGVERAPSPESRQLRAAALARIRRKPCLIIDRDTGEILARIAADLDGAGRPSRHRMQDLWIAASAIQHRFRILTRNPTEFADVPGIRVIAL
jgi:predicted nucleic acid-binding protein